MSAPSGPLPRLPRDVSPIAPLPVAAPPVPLPIDPVAELFNITLHQNVEQNKAPVAMTTWSWRWDRLKTFFGFGPKPAGEKIKNLSKELLKINAEVKVLEQRLNSYENHKSTHPYSLDYLIDCSEITYLKNKIIEKQEKAKQLYKEIAVVYIQSNQRTPEMRQIIQVAIKTFIRNEIQRLPNELIQSDPAQLLNSIIDVYKKIHNFVKSQEIPELNLIQELEVLSNYIGLVVIQMDVNIKKNPEDIQQFVENKKALERLDLLLKESPTLRNNILLQNAIGQ